MIMRPYRLIGCVALGLLAVTVYACAPLPARPLFSEWHRDYEFGYSDKRLGPARIQVTYRTPFVRTTRNIGQRSEQTGRIIGLSFDLALWRAAEIAVRDGFSAFRVGARHSKSTIDDQGEEISAPRFGLAHPRGGFRIIGSPATGFRAAWLQGSTTLEIALKRETGTGDINARATIKRLHGKHAGAHATPTN